jgi:hypothetical protein
MAGHAHVGFPSKGRLSGSLRQKLIEVLRPKDRVGEGSSMHRLRVLIEDTVVAATTQL